MNINGIFKDKERESRSPNERIQEALDYCHYAKIRRTLKDCRNELCLMCGKYKEQHLGKCDGCRWKEGYDE